MKQMKQVKQVKQMLQMLQMLHAYTCLTAREQSLYASASQIKAYQSFPRLMNAAFLYAGQPLPP
jgi:hypothetical protein